MRLSSTESSKRRGERRDGSCEVDGHGRYDGDVCVFESCICHRFVSDCGRRWARGWMLK